MRWKVAVIARRDNQRHLLPSYKHLQSLGFSDGEDDGLHVFCGQGVKVNEGEQVIRHRSREEQTERDVWIEAIETMSATYGSTTDVFLFTAPDIIYWSGLKAFCDATIEPNYVSIYLPYTPDPFYGDNPAYQLPCAVSRGAGWCQAPISEVSEVCSAIIMHRHTARVVAAYLRDTRNHLTHCWMNTVSMVITQLAKVNCFCAMPSFAAKRQLPGQKLVYGEGLLDGVKASRHENFYLN